MTDDWIAWHGRYGDSTTWQWRRLALVQECIQAALVAIAPGPVTIVDMCAGRGLDLLPLLGGHLRGGDVRARLVELQPELAQAARDEAATLPAHVEVVTGDAALTDHYLDCAPADLVLMCGIFPHIARAERVLLVRYAKALVKRGGFVVWTMNDTERATEISSAFVLGHFEPTMLFNADEQHSVHMMRHMDHPEPLRAGERMFTFVGLHKLAPEDR